MTEGKDIEKKQPCPCTQGATDLLKAIQSIKNGMLKEVKCKSCGKTSLTNFDTEHCYDCRKNMQR